MLMKAHSQVHCQSLVMVLQLYTSLFVFAVIFHVVSTEGNPSRQLFPVPWKFSNGWLLNLYCLYTERETMVYVIIYCIDRFFSIYTHSEKVTDVTGNIRGLRIALLLSIHRVGFQPWLSQILNLRNYTSMPYSSCLLFPLPPLLFPLSPSSFHSLLSSSSLSFLPRTSPSLSPTSSILLTSLLPLLSPLTYLSSSFLTPFSPPPSTHVCYNISVSNL